MKKLFILLPVMALLFLAGCQTEKPSESSSQTAPVPAATNVTQSAQSSSAPDRAAYDGAQQLKDPSFCDKISDENYKKACKDAINDQSQLEEAIVKVDAGVCAKISSADQQKACKIRIEVLLKEQENSKKQEEARKNAGTLRDQIIKTGDISRCKEIKIEGKRAECEITILTNKVSTTKNISWCDKASTAELRDQCKTVASKLKSN